MEPAVEHAARPEQAIFFAAEPDSFALTYMSPSVRGVLGWTPDELLRDPGRWVEQLHPEDRDRAMDELRAGGETRCRMRHRHGHYRQMRLVARTARDMEGQAVGVVGHAVDLGVEEGANVGSAGLHRAVNSAVRDLLEAGMRAGAMAQVLERVGTAAGAKRAYVCERSTLEAGDGPGEVRAEWAADGVTAGAEVIPLPAWEGALHAGAGVVERVADLPEGERGDLEARGIEWVAVMPVRLGEDLWGHLCVERDADAGPWTTDEREALQVVATALGEVLDRSRGEATQRTLVELLPVAVYVERLGDSFSPDYSWASDYVSPQIEAVTGHPPAAWMDPHGWLRMIHPEDQESAREADTRSARSGGPFKREYRVVRPDGSVIWVHDEAVLVRDHHDRPLFWQGVVYDCTGRKASEQKLEETEAGYRSLVESIPAVAYVDELDEQATTRFIGPQIEELMGFPPEDWVKDPDLWSKCLHPEDRQRVLAENAHHVATGEPFESDYRMVASDGRVVWVRDQAVVVRDQSGLPLFSQGVLFDITERKMAEEALQRTLGHEREVAERLRAVDEMKSTFLNAVSHELRTPLTSVLGYAATLERDDVGLSREQEREFVRHLARNARKLDRLLADLLDLDRLTRGVLEARRERTDVAALVRRVLDDIYIGDREVRLESEPIVAELDAPKVERIVENLVGNVTKHTPMSSPVWVRVWGEGDAVLIAVEDEGPGIPDVQKERIFEPFEHGRPLEIHDYAPGTGVGLSLVARFAEMHGGRAWVEDRPGGGSSFRVSLPAAWARGGADVGRLADTEADATEPAGDPDPGASEEG